MRRDKSLSIGAHGVRAAQLGLSCLRPNPNPNPYPNPNPNLNPYPNPNPRCGRRSWACRACARKCCASRWAYQPLFSPYMASVGPYIAPI